MSVKKIDYKNHPRINSVTHKYSGKSSLEEVFEKVIINYLKEAKRLD